MSERRAEYTVRTTVTLSPELAQRLSFEAETTKRSTSAVVRDALMGYFEQKKPPKLPSFTGIARSGHTDTSERVEDVIGEIIEERFDEIMGRTGSAKPGRKR